MIKVDGYKAFNGVMEITPKGKKPFTLFGDWLYKPDTNCWYGCGMSFPAEICSPHGE